MTDITTRLRDATGWQSEYVCEQAADEIDRLRAELAGHVEANRYMKGELDDALEDARKYAEAQREIVRLREALSNLLAAAEGQGGTKYDAHEIARAALSQESGR